MKKNLLRFDPYNFAQLVLILMGISVAAFLIVQISNILILFLISFFIAAALDPLIDWLEKFRISRTWGIIIVYFLSFLLISLIIAQLLPVIAGQLVSIATSINNLVLNISSPEYINTLPLAENIKVSLKEFLDTIDVKSLIIQLQSSIAIVSSQLVNLSGNVWNVMMYLFNGLMNFIIMLVLVFFLTVDENALQNFFLSIFPNKYGNYITARMNMVKQKIGHWILGQLSVCLVAALSTLIVLAIFGVKYSLTLSIIAGILMIIPVFGRVFAWIISVPIVLNQSFYALVVLSIFYLVIAQVEGNYLVPKMMSRAVGLSPLLIMFVLLVGSQLMGITGLILSIPVATIIAVFAKDIGEKIHAKTKKEALE